MLRDTRAEPNDAASRNARAGSSRPSGWCHFTCPADGAPDALRELTRQAGLHKKRLAFSFLLAAKDADLQPATPGGHYEHTGNTGDAKDAGNTGRAEHTGNPGRTGSAGNTERAGSADRGPGSGKNAGKAGAPTELRILSDPIFVPGENAPARYACSENGLALLADARHIPSLALVPASVRKDAAGGDMRDAKSGLPVYALADTRTREAGIGETRASVVTPSDKTEAPRKGNAGKTRGAVEGSRKRQNSPARRGNRRTP
jgi:hypothetical protein